jgi:hypothetical protein
MFPWILLIVVANQPLVVAGFRDLPTCELVAAHMTFPDNAPKFCKKATRA